MHSSPDREILERARDSPIVWFALFHRAWESGDASLLREAREALLRHGVAVRLIRQRQAHNHRRAKS